jgi:hypothetical protein
MWAMAGEVQWVRGLAFNGSVILSCALRRASSVCRFAVLAIQP